MDERKKQILRAIITDYISTAEPVGSRTISKKYNLGVSPATIRNEMSDLEEQGYIIQPHASAGRIPSEKGYRYYVDYLMDKTGIGKEEKRRIEDVLKENSTEFDRLINNTCHILSELSEYTSFIMMSKKSKGVLEQIQLMMINGHQALLVMVTDKGVVSHKIIDIPIPMTQERLNDISKALLSKLKGVNIDDVNRIVLDNIAREFKNEVNMADNILKVLEDTLLFGNEDDKIYLDGTLNILNQPEFRDIEKVRNILSVLKNEDIIREIIGNRTNSGMEISIGQELTNLKIDDCSIVTCTYQIDGNFIGTIGILGPTRMDYSRTSSLLDEVAGGLSKALKLLGDKGDK